MLNYVLQLMEDGENSVIGRNVRFLVEVENKKEFVHATIQLHRMTAMIAQLTDQTVLKPENVTKMLQLCHFRYIFGSICKMIVAASFC